jgi:NAD(P)-dependent dehydrogenase (short-subunit alcohol dehydrogenase family)
MLTWALADRLTDPALTANALNPGYVLTDLTTNAGGPLKILITLTSFTAQTALDGADTAIWLAASPEVEGATGKFWNKRRKVRCRFGDPSKSSSSGRSPSSRPGSPKPLPSGQSLSKQTPDSA